MTLMSENPYEPPSAPLVETGIELTQEMSLDPAMWG